MYPAYKSYGAQLFEYTFLLFYFAEGPKTLLIVLQYLNDVVQLFLIIRETKYRMQKTHIQCQFTSFCFYSIYKVKIMRLGERQEV